MADINFTATRQNIAFTQTKVDVGFTVKQAAPINFNVNQAPKEVGTFVLSKGADLTFEQKKSNIAFTVVTPTPIQMDITMSGPRGPQGVAGAQGIQGIQGDAGASPTSVFNAGEAVNGHKVVVLVSGSVFHFDPSNLSHIGRVVGVTLGAASIGTPVTVNQVGLMTNVGWGLTAGPIWAASNGGVTSTPPVTGVSQQVGVAQDMNTLLVLVGSPIITV